MSAAHRQGRVLAFAATLALAVPALAEAPARVIPETTFVTSSGETIRPGQGHGVTHLLFVARWCPPCETEVQGLRREMAQLRHAGYHVVLIGVDRRETGAEFADWVRGLGFEGAFAFDDGGRLERAVGAELLPWHAVIGPGRQVLSSSERAPDAAQLNRWLAE